MPLAEDKGHERFSGCAGAFEAGLVDDADRRGAEDPWSAPLRLSRLRTLASHRGRRALCRLPGLRLRLHVAALEAAGAAPLRIEPRHLGDQVLHRHVEEGAVLD